MRALVSAFQFLTILPLPGSHDLPDADWAAATAWYPLVGLVLGAILAGLGWVLGWFWPGSVVAALVLAAWVILTGALHLDGLADSCDALFAPVARERRLEILRDVHTGAFGVVGVVLLLLAKYAALASVAGLVGPSGWLGLILIPTSARWGMTAAVVLVPYARSGPGLGAKAKSGSGSAQLAVGSATTLLVTALAWFAGLGWGAVLILAAVAAAMLLAGLWARSRLGGLTGDLYGALCELGETAGLLAASALLFQGAMS